MTTDTWKRTQLCRADSWKQHGVGHVAPPGVLANPPSLFHFALSSMPAACCHRVLVCFRGSNWPWNECLSWHECLEFPTEMPTFFLIPSGQLRFWQWRTGWSIWSNTSQELEHPWTALLPASSHRTCNRSVVANFSQVCTLQLWEADLWRAVKSQGDSWHFFFVAASGWEAMCNKMCRCQERRTTNDGSW